MSEKAKKILDRVLKCSWWMLILLLVLLLAQVLGAKMQGKVPKIFGYSIMQIVTGSMEEHIPVGSYILVKEIDPEDVKINDVISFYSEDHKIYGLPNTHRVVGIEEGECGIEFVTRGDANPGNDRVNVKADKLIGIYVSRLDFLKSFSDFLSDGGIFTIIAVIWISTFAMMGYTIYKKLSVKSDGKEEKTKDSGEDTPE